MNSHLQFKYVVGVDEAGRGPLAGPVAVGAVIMTSDYYSQYCSRPEAGSRIKKVGGSERIATGKDSKKLSPRLRDIWHDWLSAEKRSGNLNYLVGLSSAGNIDRFGIVAAISLALIGCLQKLDVSPDETLILLDGGLRVPKDFPHQETIIRGDESEPIIALASIAAKVARDAEMIRLAELHPGYGFERHKGYGTADHYVSLKNLGPSPIHRKTFIR
jgi:ribonuclease HII